jgi:glycosyltransferase involved in cell wall biosynthesis
MPTGEINLVLITYTFPYGKGESFIGNELPFLARAFNKIYIVPLKGRTGTFQLPQRPIPANCEIILPQKKSIVEIRRPAARNLFQVARLLFKTAREEFRSRKTALQFLDPRNFFVTFMRLNRAVEYEREMDAIFRQHTISNFIVYSYWVDSWLAGLIDLRKRQQQDFPIISRAHGGDLYHYAATTGYQPHRRYIWRNIDFLFPVSQMGVRYLLERYPELKPKIRNAYLGVNDPPQRSPYSRRDTFTILSISNLIPLKRVHLLIESLKLLRGMTVRWVHIGDGELSDELEKQASALPANISYEFMGQQPNETIMKFYAENQVDLFVNVSETEGIPVSIMEAISFGVPIMATNVGGVSEIVRRDFGYLLEKDFQVNDLAQLIAGHAQRSEAEIIEMRRSAYAFFLANFNAEANYKRFIGDLKAIYAAGGKS